ncbi:DUF5960 family protein [Streptococcus suis]|uniref:DUF5960 family protein n=1 Tax=Streptococcus suis TaxID=1307 RepID=UPI0039E8C41A
MYQLEFQRNHLQMDYYSESYQDFERDFYRYSNMNIPLTFLTDDILKTMATSRKNYFVLNKEKANFCIRQTFFLKNTTLVYPMWQYILSRQSTMFCTSKVRQNYHLMAIYRFCIRYLLR